MEQKQAFNYLTYAEKRSINFGDYESRSVFISLGCDLKPHGVEINDEASSPIVEDIDKTMRKLISKVEERLDKKEAEIRQIVLDGGYSLSDQDTFEKKLIDTRNRIKSRAVKKEMKKTKVK